MGREISRLRATLDKVAWRIVKEIPNEPDAWVGWTLYLLESLETEATELRPGQTALTKREFEVLFLNKLHENILYRLTNRHW